MAFKITKEWLKTMAKEDSAVFFFFLGAYLLASNLDIIPVEILSGIVIISVILSFAVITTRIILKVHRDAVLYWAETKELKKNKAFTKIDKSLFEKGIEAGKEIFKELVKETKEATKSEKKS